MQAYGQERILYESLFAMLSYYAIHKERSKEITFIIYTDQASWYPSAISEFVKVIFFPLEKCNSFPWISKDKEKFPCIESYFNKWASVLTSAKSLTKATST